MRYQQFWVILNYSNKQKTDENAKEMAALMLA